MAGQGFKPRPRKQGRHFRYNKGRLTIRRPYGSMYDNDYYQRVQATVPLTVDGGGTAYVQMRTDLGSSTANDLALFDQPEFNNIRNNFAFYSVVGMKLEISGVFYTAAAATQVQGVRLWGGYGENVSQSGPTPLQRLDSLSLQAQGSPGGQTTTLYYAYEKDQKKLGAQFSVGTQGVYTQTNSGVIYGQCETAGLGAGDKISSVKAIWYVRFHGRRSL